MLFKKKFSYSKAFKKNARLKKIALTAEK